MNPHLVGDVLVDQRAGRRREGAHVNLSGIRGLFAVEERAHLVHGDSLNMLHADRGPVGDLLHRLHSRRLTFLSVKQFTQTLIEGVHVGDRLVPRLVLGRVHRTVLVLGAFSQLERLLVGVESPFVQRLDDFTHDR